MSYVDLGQRFASAAATIGVVQVIDPATNTKGLVLTSAVISGTTGLKYLMTGATAPANASSANPTILHIATGTVTTNGQDRDVKQLPYAVRLPAGYGLWVVSDDNNGGAALVTYDLVG